jgi:hypothetical protein
MKKLKRATRNVIRILETFYISADKCYRPELGDFQLKLLTPGFDDIVIYIYYKEGTCTLMVDPVNSHLAQHILLLIVADASPYNTGFEVAEGNYVGM